MGEFVPLAGAAEAFGDEQGHPWPGLTAHAPGFQPLDELATCAAQGTSPHRPPCVEKKRKRAEAQKERRANEKAKHERLNDDLVWCHKRIRCQPLMVRR